MDLTGDVVKGVPCPQCGDKILYNGNYFCEHIDEGCWVMPGDHEDYNAFHRMVVRTYLKQRAEEYERMNNIDEWYRMQLYLENV